VNNYYKPGPATKAKNHWMVNPSSPYGSFYVQGNYFDGNETITHDNWRGGIKAGHPDSARAASPFAVEPVQVQEAVAAFDLVLKGAGASLKRDVVDKRVVQEVRSGTASLGKEKNGIIDSQQDAGGWPVLQSLPPLKDTDGDGLSDEWETKHTLNPQDASDGAKQPAGSSYSNLELYLNEIVKEVIHG
jgi:hypothetical protein